jgi:two-component system, NarL family, nitrate/nitrite response regulator NarL
MTRHVLVTPRADVSARWQEAFPAGRRVPSLTAARAVRGPAIVWLDLTNMQQDARSAAIAACASREVAVVALNTQPNAEEARLSLRAGARGYCHALAAPAQLKRVATVVRRNGYWLGRELVSRLAAALRGLAAEKQAPRRAQRAEGERSQAASPGIERLGERERQIAEQIAHGASNREVAASLGLAEGQVRFHLAAILDRLRLGNRVQLALRYHP